MKTLDTITRSMLVALYFILYIICVLAILTITSSILSWGMHRAATATSEVMWCIACGLGFVIVALSLLNFWGRKIIRVLEGIDEDIEGG